MSNERRISVYDNKYTFVLKPNDYLVHVLRHGEPWVTIENGCNAVRQLVWEAIDDRGLVAAVRRWATLGDGFQDHSELHQAFRAFCDERGATKPPELENGWRTDAPPRGVRCLVTVRTVCRGEVGVLLASVSPDHEGTAWFSNGTRLHEVIAWMPAPEPFAP